jgi:hypothetical protein
LTSAAGSSASTGTLLDKDSKSVNSATDLMRGRLAESARIARVIGIYP